MTSAEEGLERAPVPEWAVRLLRAVLREYRYHTRLIPTMSETLQLEVLRGDRPAGLLSIDHAWRKVPPERHDLRLLFQGAQGDHEERFTPHSLAQLQAYAPVLAGRICQYGNRLDPSWCNDCTFSQRHKAGLFDPPRAAPRTA